MKRVQTILLSILAGLFIFTLTAKAADWTVTKSSNSNDGVCNADCSLREAVAAADSGDTVIFDSNLVGQTFTLGGSEIVIAKRITIDGFINDPNVAFISGEMTSRIFRLQTGSGLILKNATLVQGNGKTDANSQGDGEGGAIFALNASLSLDRVAFRGNSAKYSGAVSLRGGTHHFINSSFTGNTAETNTALGISFDATVYMSNTTVSNNQYYVGADDTFGGGAILLSNGSLFVRNSTIVNNSGKLGGGIAYHAGGGVLDIGNTIVAENTATDSGQDILFLNGLTITSRGGNLIGNLNTVPANTFNQPNDIFGVNPLLGPLNANLGGFPVLSHPLQAGSPARQGGINAVAVDPLTSEPLLKDARGTGFPRITDTTVDKGAFEDQSGNTSLIVTKKPDTNDLVCDTDCSLREAVHQASLNFGTDTITFAPNVFGNMPHAGTEILIQNHNVNIVGYPTLNANTLTVSGNNASRVFRLNNATVSISGMTLADGNAGAGFGGAVLSENNSNLTLDRMIVSGSFAAAYGAIYLSGGTGHFTNSTISTNSANTGLAIAVSGTLNMANTTVSGNFDADGGTGIGAIFITGTANIRNSTIAFNRTSGGTGGGIFSAGTLNIGNSIVANNIALISPDIALSSGVITSSGGNLVQNTNGFPAGTFDETNDAAEVDPMLGVLTNNGGNVTTHMLLPNSPAINAGINANAVDPFDLSLLVNDARGAGFSRVVSIVDKGAFETLIPTAAGVSVGGRVVTADSTGVSKARVLLTDHNGSTRFVLTNNFGFFTFTAVEAGETYIVTVTSKRHSFAGQVVSVTDNVSDLNFIADGGGRNR